VRPDNLRWGKGKLFAAAFLGVVEGKAFAKRPPPHPPPQGGKGGEGVSRGFRFKCPDFRLLFSLLPHTTGCASEEEGEKIDTI